jgi:hypothetical protein
MAAPAQKRRDDIRVIFDCLSDDVLLDDAQVGLLAGRAPATVKRWRRQGRAPPCVRLNGAPRYRVGDVRPWLRGRTHPLV